MPIPPKTSYLAACADKSAHVADSNERQDGTLDCADDRITGVQW